MAKKEKRPCEKTLVIREGGTKTIDPKKEEKKDAS